MIKIYFDIICIALTFIIIANVLIINLAHFYYIIKRTIKYTSKEKNKTQRLTALVDKDKRLAFMLNLNIKSLV